jgi:Right handed beta helix region
MQKVSTLLFIMFFYCNSYATNYYVSPTGINTNTGTLASPLLTVQAGINKAFGGDTVFVRAGTYNEKLTWTRSGALNSMITLKKYKDEVVIIDGTGKTALNMLIVDTKSYLEINGIIFQNNYRQDANGIYVFGGGTAVYIKNCTVRNIGWTTNANADPFTPNPDGQAHGILINGRTVAGYTDVKLLNSKVHDIISGNSEAVTFVGNIDGFLVEKDTIYNTKNIALVLAGNYSWAINSGVSASLNQTRNGVVKQCVVYDNRRFSNLYAPAGIYVDGGKNIDIINNTVYKNGNGISVGCENAGSEARNIFLSNNISYNNDGHGIVFGSNAAIIKKCTLVNNTFYKNGSIANFYSEINLQKSDSCIVGNNIATMRSDNHYGIGIFGYTATNLTVSNNLLYRYSGNAANLYVQDPPSPVQFVPTNTINANPVFIDENILSPNLYINKTSAAINIGSNSLNTVIQTDAAFDYRMVNGTIDAGAYERQDGGCPTIHTISDVQLLKGKFISSQKIIFDQTLVPIISNPLLWTSPIIDINKSIKVDTSLQVNNVGCN